MRDINRINAEIRMLEHYYGKDRVGWDRGYNWVMIRGWRLPQNLNKAETNILILIPPNYGNGENLRHAFIAPDIQARNNKTGNFEDIPHYFQEYPYAKLILGSKGEYREKNWRYICIHQKCLGNRINIQQYLIHIYKFLSDPFRDWGQTFNSYSR